MAEAVVIAPYKRYVDLNTLLPEAYAAAVAEEQAAATAALVAGLEQCHAQRDFARGAVHWLKVLTEHMQLKYDLSRAQRTALARAALKFVFADDCDLVLQGRYARHCSALIKKENSVDLVLPWRPFYELINKHYFLKERAVRFVQRDTHGTPIASLAFHARQYFGPGATAEILAEFRPLLCPYDQLAFKAQSFLCALLPTLSGDHGLWLDEMMRTRLWIENCPGWDFQWIRLFQELAKDMAGRVDWSPYLPGLFAQFLRHLDVPVGGRAAFGHPQAVLPEDCDLFTPSPKLIDSSRVQTSAKFVAYVLAPESPAWDLLQQLIFGIESYFHPSNGGPWTMRLAYFMNALIHQVARRVGHERREKCRTPADKKLGRPEIDRFVKLMHPIVSQALFSKNPRMVMAAIQSFKELTSLSPDFILPLFLERAYPALQTLTQTHQTVSVIECMAVVSRIFFNHAYSVEGAAHLGSMLELTLPGIDANDFPKTLATLKFFSALFSFTPMVDSADLLPLDDAAAAADKTLMEYLERVHPDFDAFRAAVASEAYCEEQRPAARLASEFFTDFCFQYLERLFSMFPFQMPSKKSTKDAQETYVRMHYQQCNILFFTQMSPALLAKCADKVVRYLDSNMHPNALKMVGQLCSSMSYADPKMILAKVIPMAYRNLVRGDKLATTSESELLWYLRIMEQSVRRSGLALLPYEKQITTVLGLTLKYEASTKVAKAAGKLLRNSLKACVVLYHQDLRSVPARVWSSPSFRQHPYYTWGVPGSFEHLEPTWHVPSDTELAFASRLLETFLLPELVKLETSLDTLDKAAYRRTLQVVRSSLRGVAAALPEWECGSESEVARTDGFPALPARLPVETGRYYLRSSSGQLEGTAGNLRLRIGAVMHACIGFAMKRFADDVSTLNLSTKVVHVLLHNRGVPYSRAHTGKRTYHMAKGLQMDNVHGHKQHARWLLMERVSLGHLLRITQVPFHNGFHPQHRELVDDLVTLSMSLYAKVRTKAQTALHATVKRHPASLEHILERVLKGFAPGATEAQTNGAVYILNQNSLIEQVCHNLEMLSDLVKAVSLSHYQDKASIQNRLSSLVMTLGQQYHQVPLEHAPGDGPTAAAVVAGNERRRQIHSETMEYLVAQFSTPSLPWKYKVTVASFLMMMLRPDSEPPVAVTQLFLRGLVSDIVPLRGICMKAFGIVLTETSPVQPRIPNPLGPEPARESFLHDMRKTPTKEEWEQAVFFDKNYFGWRGCSPSAVAYQPWAARASQDMVPNRASEELNAAVKGAFFDRAFVEQFVDCLSNEHRQGHSLSFDEDKAQVFKGLFKNYGLPLVSVFKDVVAKRQQETSERVSQCVAAEILGGMIRGCKHWPYDDIVQLRDYLTATLRQAVSMVNTDDIDVWSTLLRFGVYDRDLRRLFVLSDFLFGEDFESGSSGAQARRYRFLYVVSSEMSWRDRLVAQPVAETLATQLGHPYKQVRERISMLLSVMLRAAWTPSTERNGQASLSDWVEMVTSKLEASLEATRGFGKLRNADDASANKEEIATALSLRRTTLSWINVTLSAGYGRSIERVCTRLLEHLFSALDEGEQELSREVQACLSMVCRAPVSAETLSKWLETLVALTESPSWHVRHAVLPFLRVLAFKQSFFVTSEQRRKLFELMVRLLNDDQLEVRELASVSLAGVLKTMPENEVQALCGRFVDMSKNKLVPRKKIKDTPADEVKAAMVKRHSGVLGMAAIVRVFPYGVPDWLPEILVRLAGHIADPSPVHETVKNAFSDFWKTHEDMWPLYKEKFTEEQLSSLTQLLVSPSYFM